LLEIWSAKRCSMNPTKTPARRARSGPTRGIHEVPIESIERAILLMRGQRVILDSALAALYGVATGRLNAAVKRNAERFPRDFVFQLTAAELANLRSQFAISSWGGRRYHPFAFTEHGAIQAANVLNSPRAVAMGVYVVRAFVRLRETFNANKELALKLDQLEARLERRLATHDETIAAILATIRGLMNPVAAKSRGIGFTADLRQK